jgi:WD40 repeat protein
MVWDGESGQELHSIKRAGSFVTFSPDGKRLASASGVDDYAVKVWDAQTGKELVDVKAGHAGMLVNCVAFSPDGKRLASAGGDRTVRIWNSETGQELVTFKGHTNMANSVAFSPDGTRLASAAREGTARRDGTVRVWDATASSGAPTIGGLTRAVTSIAFSPDGKRRAVGIRAWDDNKQAFTAGELKVLDAQTNQELINIKGLAGEVLCLVFSPDGKRLAGGDDKTAKVDAETGREPVPSGDIGTGSPGWFSARMANAWQAWMHEPRWVPHGERGRDAQSATNNSL